MNLLTMKLFLVCLILSSPAAVIAEENSRLIFPPFYGEDLKKTIHPLPESLSYEDRKAIPLEELRGFMTYGNSMDEGTAIRELMERGDLKTMLRLVYSCKQGNVGAEMLLMDSGSLAAVPYLMEDVAHGSMEYYGTFEGSDTTFGSGRVRAAAVKRVASILANAPEFTGEARDCLRAVSSGRESEIQVLSDESRYLVQWWLLNADAFEAGRWQDIQPLPQEISYAHSKDDPFFLNEDLENQPPVGSPAWELPESFEVWAARIVDPKRRNLDFVALSWDGKKVIEHPAKSLDPKAKSEERESHKTPAPRNPPEPESGDSLMGKKGISWIIVLASFLVALSIAWWMKRRRVV